MTLLQKHGRSTCILRNSRTRERASLCLLRANSVSCLIVSPLLEMCMKLDPLADKISKELSEKFALIQPLASIQILVSSTMDFRR